MIEKLKIAAYNLLFFVCLFALIGGAQLYFFIGMGGNEENIKANITAFMETVNPTDWNLFWLVRSTFGGVILFYWIVVTQSINLLEVFFKREEWLFYRKKFKYRKKKGKK